jgi:hypothetical protein
VDDPLVLTPAKTLPSALSRKIGEEMYRLTSRDRRLLDLLAAHQCLTTEQITALAFTTDRKARRRLLVLYQRDVLDRFRFPTGPGSLSWRWTLGPVGAAVVAGSADQPTPRPGAVRAATARLAASPRLHHLLEVNQFFCALAAYARHHPETMLLRWWSERQATHATGGIVHPDGAGRWAQAGHRVPFWLELDRGTEQLSRLAAKLIGYQRLAGTELAWPVLFWLPTRTREANLHKLLGAEYAGMVVATATGGTGDAHPLGPVWRLPGQSGTARRRLHEIPITAGHEGGGWHA